MIGQQPPIVGEHAGVKKIDILQSILSQNTFKIFLVILISCQNIGVRGVRLSCEILM